MLNAPFLLYNLKCSTSAYKIVEREGVKMIKNSRIGLRLEPDIREKAEKLVESGKFKSLSEVVREALRRFLESEVS